MTYRQIHKILMSCKQQMKKLDKHSITKITHHNWGWKEMYNQMNGTTTISLADSNSKQISKMLLTSIY